MNTSISKIKTLSIGCCALLGLAVQASAATFLVNDFDGNGVLGFGNASGGSVATVNIPGDADNERRKISDAATGFNQYFATGGNAIGRTGDLIDAFDTGDSISLQLLSLDTELDRNIRVRFVINSDAWGSGSNYRALNFVNLNDGADRDTTLTQPFTGAINTLVDNWIAGQGTFFQIFLDNGGTGNNAGNTFYIDDVVINNVPIPEPAGAALLGFGGIAFLLKRRRRL